MQPLVLLQKAKVRECSLRRRCAASCTVHLVCTGTQTSGNSLFITQKITQNTQKKKKLYTFSLWGSSVLEEDMQGSCEVSVFGDTQNPAWHGSEQWSWTRWSAVVSLQWLCRATGKSFRLWKVTVFRTFRSCPCDTQLQTWQHCGWLWEQPSFGSRNLWSYPAPFPGQPQEHSLSQQANTHVGAEGTVLWHKHVQM